MRPTNFFGLLALPAIASGFVVEFWTSPDCEGDPAGSVNVWDNSCANHDKLKKTLSIKPLHLGGDNQVGSFYHCNICWGLWGIYDTYHTDGSDPDFQVGKCVNFSHTVNAMGSHWDIIHDGLDTIGDLGDAADECSRALRG